MFVVVRNRRFELHRTSVYAVSPVVLQSIITISYYRNKRWIADSIKEDLQQRGSDMRQEAERVKGRSGRTLSMQPHRRQSQRRRRRRSKRRNIHPKQSMFLHFIID